MHACMEIKLRKTTHNLPEETVDATSTAYLNSSSRSLSDASSHNVADANARARRQGKMTLTRAFENGQPAERFSIDESSKMVG